MAQRFPERLHRPLVRMGSGNEALLGNPGVSPTKSGLTPSGLHCDFN
jgi:hypothetical protein